MGMRFIYDKVNDRWVDVRDTWLWLNKTPLENYCNSRGIRRY